MMSKRWKDLPHTIFVPQSVLNWHLAASRTCKMGIDRRIKLCGSPERMPKRWSSLLIRFKLQLSMTPHHLTIQKRLSLITRRNLSRVGTRHELQTTKFALTCSTQKATNPPLIIFTRCEVATSSKASKKMALTISLTRDLRRRKARKFQLLRIASSLSPQRKNVKVILRSSTVESSNPAMGTITLRKKSLAMTAT